MAGQNKKLKITRINKYSDQLKRFGLSETAFCMLVYKRKNLYVLSYGGERLAIEKRVAEGVVVEYV